jgi:hypothetical protein
VKPCAWDLLFKSKLLRDLKDKLLLNRNYFPGVDLKSFDEKSQINEIEEDFRIAYQGM